MKKTTKGLEAVRGLNSLKGESASALYERVKRSCGEGESPSAVYARFSGIPASLLGLAMAKAAREKWSSLKACDEFGIDADYIPAWNSAAKAVGVQHELSAPTAATSEAYNFSTEAEATLEASAANTEAAPEVTPEPAKKR